MEQTDRCKRGGGRWGLVERWEGISQRTYMNNPWTWTMVRGLTVGVGGGWVEGGKGKNWDNWNSINKIFKLKIIKK